MKFEGRPLTEVERKFAIGRAPEGTILIVHGIMNWHNRQGWCGCLRYFDKDYNVLKEIPHR